MTTEEIQKRIEEKRQIKQKPVKIVVRTKSIIEAIEKQGYRVKITHYRYFGNRLLKNVDVRVLMKSLKILGTYATEAVRREGEFIQGRGGLTVAEAYTPNGFSSKSKPLFSAETACSLSDNFVYSKGAKLALARLIDNLPPTEDLTLLKTQIFESL